MSSTTDTPGCQAQVNADLLTSLTRSHSRNLAIAPDVHKCRGGARGALKPKWRGLAELADYQLQKGGRYKWINRIGVSAAKEPRPGRPALVQASQRRHFSSAPSDEQSTSGCRPPNLQGHRHQRARRVLSANPSVTVCTAAFQVNRIGILITVEYAEYAEEIS